MELATEDVPKTSARPRAHWVPALGWLRKYRGEWLWGDLMAGLTLAAYLLPAGIGDASLANLPPESGLYACLFSGLVYWLFCSSRLTSITVTSAISLLVGASLSNIAGGDTSRFGALAAGTALLVSLIAFVAWVFRAGTIVNFISESVMVGFKCGVALFLASTQLPKLFGFKGSHGSFWERGWHFITHLGETNRVSLLLGLSALAVIVLGKFLLKHKPVALFVVVGGILAATVFHLDGRGVSLLGKVPHGVPAPRVPAVGWSDVNELLPLALACFLLGAVETAAIGRMFAAKYRGRFDANQEFLALAAANLATGLGRAFPVSGGMSQSLVNEGGGARTPLSGLIASLFILVVVMFFSELLHNLPQPVLAAIVLAAVMGLFNVSALRWLWRESRGEFVVAMAALMGVLTSGLLRGVLIGAVISLIRVIHRAARPHVALLGRIAGTRRFSDRERHRDNELIPGILIFRPEAGLFYFNIDHVKDTILDYVSHQTDAPRAVVIDLSAAPYVDLQSAEVLAQMADELKASGIVLQAVEARATVRDRLRACAADAKLGGINRFSSVADVVDALGGEAVVKSRPVSAVSHPAPLGATVVDGGVNFSIFSRDATSIELLLFERESDAKPFSVIPINPVSNRTYHYWHVFVPGLKAGQIYGYRVGGPFEPERGLRFDASRILLDPYGRGVAVPSNYDREAIKKPGDHTAISMKSVVVDPSTYDWEGDEPFRLPSARTVIYEMHAGAFTRNPNSGVTEGARGTFAGLIEKIPYLQDLGITAVELLPVFQFDAQDCPPGLVNFWGYQPVSFFAPHTAYSSRRDALGAVDEFRDMVKALHRAGIEVILDVVFNHTSEGNHTGPTFCFRGFDNPTYYILEQDRSRYADFSGCGNTLNANNPIVRRMIVDSIRYWVQVMQGDGFRFDLASILSRDPSGNVLPSPPVLWDLETDPVLAGTKFIAEAWDAAGLYQVGHFVGDSWKEWNGLFRDDARRFFRGDNGSLRRFADRLVGSPNLYRHKVREPEQSVNFVTCHDGFTLNDLVSYNSKHNEANGEQNRDGSNDNLSWNCGTEGPTHDPAVETLRNRQVKNLLTVTLLSIGMPMILMGDEVRRTQNGNNNGYCHDDPRNWFDWGLVEKRADVRRFVKLLCARRVLRAAGHEQLRLSLDQLLRQAEKGWHGVKLDRPDWHDNSHSIALTALLRQDGLVAHLILNAYRDKLDFELPPRSVESGCWRRWIDTGLQSPKDIVPWEEAPEVSADSYSAQAHSVVLLFARQ